MLLEEQRCSPIIPCLECQVWPILWILVSIRLNRSLDLYKLLLLASTSVISIIKLSLNLVNPMRSTNSMIKLSDFGKYLWKRSASREKERRQIRPKSNLLRRVVSAWLWSMIQLRAWLGLQARTDALPLLTLKDSSIRFAKMIVWF